MRSRAGEDGGAPPDLQASVHGGEGEGEQQQRDDAGQGRYRSRVACRLARRELGSIVRSFLVCMTITIE